MLSNSKHFSAHHLASIRASLQELDENRWIYLQTTQFKDPTVSLIVSIVGGTFGIDRFLIGDTGLGFAKLLTCGGIGIWTVVDWFLIMAATKEKNIIDFNRLVF